MIPVWLGLFPKRGSAGGCGFDGRGSAGLREGGKRRGFHWNTRTKKKKMNKKKKEHEEKEDIYEKKCVNDEENKRERIKDMEGLEGRM